MSPGHGRLLVTVLATVVIALAAPRRAHAAVACGAPDADNTSLCAVDPAIDPGALCNDGTPPVFWFRPGSGRGIGNWVIWLEGGSQCIDQTSCTERAAATPLLLTSNGYTAADGVGILSSAPLANPDLYNANTLQIHYCSSDDWTGNFTPSTSFVPSNPTTWYFQGRRIALAAIRSLAELPYGFSAATLIVLGGSSAGGVGMTDDLNDILPILPATARTLLVNDAGFTLDIGQFDPAIPRPYISPIKPDAFEANYLSGMALWLGRGDARCAPLATTPLQQVSCYNTAYLLQNGFIAPPSFVAESQIDTAQMTDELCPQLYGDCAVPAHRLSKQGQYAVSFGTTMAATLLGAGTQAAHSAASPDVYEHVILEDPILFQKPFKISGGTISPEALFHVWFANPTGPRSVVLGNAPGVN